uniref:Retrovirus-related Pol polyprotein from transposon TNT 1-94-like beta-barrel domain-containing protein n=1 Tax=Brassica oleracea var. oleracea TaxID=109376 RepID=A0A0D2ZZ99_BRAOL
RGNNDQEYLRRADLDALIKIFKENGNTFGYSFGARAIENYKDLTRTDRMHENLIEMVNPSRIANLARNDHAFKPSSILAHIASNQNIKPLVVDSGASHHMISDTSLIKDIVPMNGNVMIANGDKIPIRGIGSLKLFNKETKAFYMPEFTSNFLSVKKCATDLQCNVIF